METTLLIKLKKDVKDKAAKVAEDIGIPLSTLVSAFLKNFIHEKKVLLSVEARITKDKIKEWDKIVREYKKNPSKYKTFSSAEDLTDYLEL